MQYCSQLVAVISAKSNRVLIAKGLKQHRTANEQLGTDKTVGANCRSGLHQSMHSISPNRFLKIFLPSLKHSTPHPGCDLAFAVKRPLDFQVY